MKKLSDPSVRQWQKQRKTLMVAHRAEVIRCNREVVRMQTELEETKKQLRLAHNESAVLHMDQRSTKKELAMKTEQVGVLYEALKLAHCVMNEAREGYRMDNRPAPKYGESRLRPQ